MSLRRKVSQTDGLKMASVVRVLKSGAKVHFDKENKDVRVSEDAAAMAVLTTEVMLKMLAGAIAEHLKIAGKKTVTKEVILAVIKDHFLCKGFDHMIAMTGKGRDRNKKDRRSIAEVSVKRVFSRECPLSRSSYHIAKDASDGLTAVVEDFVKKLGQDAALYASAAKRNTIYTADIAKVIQQRG